MFYTVKKLAKFSGVSVRTLHWYDEIGLLQPHARGENGYRQYGEAELLRLQQILFFRELGFGLKDIQTLLTQDDFDHAQALHTHRSQLQSEIAHKQTLIQTIDNTIQHLEGTLKMTDADFYKGFDKSRQKEYEQYIVKAQGHRGELLLQQSKKRTAQWDGAVWDKVKAEGDAIYKDLAQAMVAKEAPESEVVQAIIERHFHLTMRFYDVTKDVYEGLADLYADHPDFKKFFDVYHADMIPFIGQAMRFYAQKNL